MMDGEIAKSKLDNLMAPMSGLYAGDNRFEVLNSALWHISDHYGIPPYERHRAASKPLGC